jgi:hypothetical protein
MLLITMGEKKMKSGYSPLVEAFSDCFYKPNHSYKEQIIKRFYASNHEFSFMDKVITIAKSVKRVLPENPLKIIGYSN